MDQFNLELARRGPASAQTECTFLRCSRETISPKSAGTLS